MRMICNIIQSCDDFWFALNPEQKIRFEQYVAENLWRVREVLQFLEQSGMIHVAEPIIIKNCAVLMLAGREPGREFTMWSAANGNEELAKTEYMVKTKLPEISLEDKLIQMENYGMDAEEIDLLLPVISGGECTELTAYKIEKNKRTSENRHPLEKNFSEIGIVRACGDYWFTLTESQKSRILCFCRLEHNRSGIMEFLAFVEQYGITFQDILREYAVCLISGSAETVEETGFFGIAASIQQSKKA